MYIKINNKVVNAFKVDYISVVHKLSPLSRVILRNKLAPLSPDNKALIGDYDSFILDQDTFPIWRSLSREDALSLSNLIEQVQFNDDNILEYLPELNKVYGYFFYVTYPHYEGGNSILSKLYPDLESATLAQENLIQLLNNMESKLISVQI